MSQTREDDDRPELDGYGVPAKTITGYPHTGGIGVPAKFPTISGDE